MYPTLSLLMMITSFTLIHIPKTSGQDQQFITCGEPFECGNMSFAYPFWGGNRPESCGYPGFNLSCQDNVPRFTVESVVYRVLSPVHNSTLVYRVRSPVHNSTHTLTVARDDLWADNCPQFLHDTNLDFNIFSLPNNIGNITLSYNCTTDPKVQTPSPFLFYCDVNDTKSVGFLSSVVKREAEGGTVMVSDVVNTDSCTNIIRVPINNPAAFLRIMNTSTLRSALTDGFPLQYEANNSVCNTCSQSGGRCGYNTGFKSFACYCSDKEYDLECNGTSTQNRRGRNRGLNLKTGLLIGIPVAGIIFILAVCLIYCLAKRCSLWKALIFWKLKDGNNQQFEAFMKNYGSLAPKLYSYSQIKRTTNSFADKLGQGGYGSVYRGKLPDGRKVAVKVLNDNKGNGEDFINEVASISRTSHVNVVTLLGFCYNRNKRALIYEFMPNGSLDGFICKTRSSQDTTAGCHLDLKILYEIAVGIARGLEYLHRGCNMRIVHFDIKPHNILLDKDFCPKISDFGLAKLCERKQSILSMTGARGTAGYIAPEVFCRNFGGVSHKSDVYSYGMVLLDIVGLRKKIETGSEQSSENYFPNWIYEHLELGKDLEIQGATSQEEEENSRKMILVGLWCIQTNPADSPSMSKVVEMLEGGLEHLQIPPKPFHDPPPMARNSIQESWTSSIS